MIDQTFTQDDLDTRDPQALEEAGWFRATKTTPTLMRWIDGGFRCLTREGYIDIDDEEHGGAYVAIDAEGFPYPIAATVYDATYKRLEPDAGAENAIDAAPQMPLTETPVVYVSLQEIVSAKEADILSREEAHTAATAMLRKSGILNDVAEQAPTE